VTLTQVNLIQVNLINESASFKVRQATFSGFFQDSAFKTRQELPKIFSLELGIFMIIKPQ
jgi:hypothetical protein